MSTIDIIDQPRHPAGAAGGRGGEFAEKRNSAPEGALMAENATGSFLFPPTNTFTTAEQLIEFFTTQPISDRVLSNARWAYKKWRYEQVTAMSKAELNAWRLSKDGQSVSKRDDFTFILNLERNKAIDRANAYYSTREMPASYARTILVAHQISGFRGLLASEEEQGKAYSHPMVLDGVQDTAAGIAIKWKTDDYLDRALTESDLQAVDSMENVFAYLIERDEQGHGPL